MPTSDIAWAVDARAETYEAYEVCDDYYGGNHNLTFATEKFRNAFGATFQKLRDNICPAVVEAEADRIYISAWDGKDASAATKLWANCKVSRTVRAAVVNSVKQGDGFIIVAESDNDQGVAFWNFDPTVVGVQYDDDDDPTKIVKGYRLWQRGDRKWRLNLYYEDGCEKYRTRRGVDGPPKQPNVWEQFAAEDYDYGRPPIFHLAHNAQPGEMGTSILKDVIPLQDALNKSLCDMMVASEFMAMPQRYATGLQVEIDEETGKPRNPPFTPGVDRIWTAGDDVKFGQFPSGEVRGYLEVQDSITHKVSRVTGVPPHLLYLETAMPTGETLRTLEGRLVKQVEHQEENFGPELQDMMELGLLISAGKRDADVRPVWGPSAPHNPLLDAETELVRQQVGVSKRESLRNLGFSDEKIEEMMKENEDEAKKKASMAVQQAQRTAVAPPGGPTAFDRNGSPGQPSKVAPQQQQAKMPIAKAANRPGL